MSKLIDNISRAIGVFLIVAAFVLRTIFFPYITYGSMFYWVACIGILVVISIGLNYELTYNRRRQKENPGHTPNPIYLVIGIVVLIFNIGLVSYDLGRTARTINLKEDWKHELQSSYNSFMKGFNDGVNRADSMHMTPAERFIHRHTPKANPAKRHDSLPQPKDSSHIR